MLNKNYDEWLKVELDTKVKNIIEEDGKYWTSFEDTIFYVLSGGQKDDRGSINGHEVLALKEQENELYHLLDTKLEDEVHMLVDLDYRIMKAQIHSAQHVMCSYINKHYDAKTVAFFNDDLEAGAEMAFENINDEIIKDIENFVNDYIEKDYPVEIFYPTKEEAAPFVKLYKLDHDELRGVKIGDVDYDMCACIHVPSLRYIKGFEITHVEKTTRGYKIYFLCGNQLIETNRKYYQILNHLGTKLASPIFEIEDSLDKLNNEIKELKLQVASFKEEKLLSIKDELLNNNSHAIIKVLDNFDNKDLTKLASLVTNEKECILFLVNNLGEKMHVVVSRSKTLDINVRDIFKTLSDTYGLRGGGNPAVCQGGGVLNLDITNTIDELVKGL